MGNKKPPLTLWAVVPLKSSSSYIAAFSNFFCLLISLFFIPLLYFLHRFSHLYTRSCHHSPLVLFASLLFFIPSTSIIKYQNTHSGNSCNINFFLQSTMPLETDGKTKIYKLNEEKFTCKTRKSMVPRRIEPAC